LILQPMATQEVIGVGSESYRVTPRLPIRTRHCKNNL
jgi:hypothetical protein